MHVCGKQQDRLEFIENIKLSLVDPKDKHAKEIRKSMEELAKDG